MPHNASMPVARKAERKRAAAARRALRADRYDGLFEPGAQAAAGALASLAFLFQPRLDLKLALCLLFLFIASASGKKVSLPAALLVSLGIVAANLLQPVGRVLWRLGPLVITETALAEGIEKAATFEGLVFISKASIRPGLRVPGRFGSIVAAAFVYYDRIVEYKGRIRARSFVADVDALMLSLSASGEAPAAAAEAPRDKPLAGRALLAAALLVAFAALALGLSLPRA
jgi:hypothetical protein